MRIQLATFAFAAALLGVTTQAHALLITNGGFEDSYLPNGSTPIGQVNGIPLANLTQPSWDVYNVYPGWARLDGAGVEVQAGTITEPHSGNRYIELDSNKTTPTSHSNTTIYQNVSVVAGQKYQLDFFYFARPYATPAAGIPNQFGNTTDAIEYGFAGQSSKVDGVPGQGWVHISQQYVAGSTGSTRLIFGAIGLQDSYGGFLDDVSLKAIPELDPKAGGTAFLLLAGAIAVLTGRRRAIG